MTDLCSWVVGLWSRFAVLDVGAHKDSSIIGEAEVYICVEDRIQIVVPSSVDTPSDWVV